MIKKVIFEKPDGTKVVGFLDTETELIYFNYMTLELAKSLGWKKVEE